MEEFKFKLNEELGEKDSIGYGYEYSAVPHPVAKDIIVVHYEVAGTWDTVNYNIKDVKSFIKKEEWIVL